MFAKNYLQFNNNISQYIELTTPGNVCNKKIPKTCKSKVKNKIKHFTSYQTLIMQYMVFSLRRNKIIIQGVKVQYDYYVLYIFL